MREKFENFVKSKFGRWLKAAGIRAIKTVAQTVAGIISSCVVLGDIDWRFVVSSALLAGLYSLLTSTGGLPEVRKEEEATEKTTKE